MPTRKSLKGQEIVSNRKEIISKLNQAMAAEGLSGYLFLFFSKTVTGKGAHETAEILTRMAASEQLHMAELMERIIQLGGEPLTSPAQWEKASHCKYFPPKANSYPKDVLEECIRLEEHAIQFYQELAHQTQHTDYVTFQLVSKLLADEVGDEHKLTNAQ